MNMNLAEIIIPFIIGLIVVGGIWFVISQSKKNQKPSGGSGGGGVAGAVADYANMFEELELPQWMLDWKPIIEAILGGVLGAIVLPKIFNWLKIITL